MNIFKRSNSLEISSSLSKNKGLELNLYFKDLKGYWTYFNLDLCWSFKGDHAGFTFRVQLWRFEVELKIYDARHWNWEADRWYLPGEEQEELNTK